MLKTVFAFTIIFATTLATQAQTQQQPWSGLTPLRYRSSVHSMAISRTTNGVNRLYPAVCINAIRSHLQRGGDFRSYTMTQYSRPLGAFPRAQSSRGVLYHFTNAPELIRIAQNHSYEDIFNFLRTRPQDDPLETNEESKRWFLYVGDEDTGRQFGNIKVTITVPRVMRVFYSDGDLPGRNIPRGRLIRMIEDELILRDPQLRACRTDTDSPMATSVAGGQQPLLVTLAMEAHQVALVAYYGINNARYDHRHQWFQVVGPWAIGSMTAESLH